MSTYFYSGQIRRFIQQFIRLLNNFQIKLNSEDNTAGTLLRVPIYYGDSSRQVAVILARNSENNLNTVPAMSVYISGIKYDRPRVQESQHVSKMQIRERAYDPETGDYTDKQGDLLTVERLMPVPYMLNLKVDIWTTNTDQKLQLIEQIAVLFNPSLEIQSTDSYVDWTSLTYVTLLDVNHSSRSVPLGPEDPIDVATLTFELPIWLSAPAKVKKQGVIHKITASIYADTGLRPTDDYFDIQGGVVATKQIYTPINLNVVYIGNTLKLYVNDNETEFSGGDLPNMNEGNWALAVRSFGELAGVNTDLLRNGISQIRLYNDGITIVGTVAYHPTDESLLLFNVDTDTLPVNTLPPVSAIIDPQNFKVTPAIANPMPGTRLLLLNSIGYANDTEGPELWNRTGYPMLVANEYDIIEFNGNNWYVAFDSASTNTIQYVTNLSTGIQFKWKNQIWNKSVQGRYGVGAWSFVPNW